MALGVAHLRGEGPDGRDSGDAAVPLLGNNHLARLGLAGGFVFLLLMWARLLADEPENRHVLVALGVAWVRICAGSWCTLVLVEAIAVVAHDGLRPSVVPALGTFMHRWRLLGWLQTARPPRLAAIPLIACAAHEAAG